MKRWPLLLPFLFAASPVLTLYASNAGQIGFAETFLPAAAVVAATALLLPLLAVAFRSTLRAAVALSIFWWVFFSYGHVASIIGKHPLGDRNPANPKFFLPLTCILLAAVISWLVRRKPEPVLLARVLLVIAIATLVSSAITGVRAGVSRKPFDPASVVPAEPIVAGTVTRKPDIFYIIFDRFGSNSTLRRRYHYDATPFVEHLRARGFYVADDSRANYLVTAQSLASSLNMVHLLPLTDVVGHDSSDWLPVFDLLADYRLRRFLATQGYRYVHVGPKWTPTAKSAFAQRNVRFAAVPEFTSMLITTTAAQPVLVSLGVGDQDREKYERLRYQLRVLETLPREEPEPLFVFAHFLIPHGAYVFNGDGSYREPSVSHVHSEAENYVAQVDFVQARTRTLVDSLLASYGPDNPPVIVVQGDEGPYPPRTQPHEFQWHDATDEEISEKMRILNAIYAPGCESHFYPSMTPVNTFRILLNSYFGTSLEPLPDRSYSYRDLKGLYDYFEVTDRIDAVGTSAAGD